LNQCTIDSSGDITSDLHIESWGETYGIVIRTAYSPEFSLTNTDIHFSGSLYVGSGSGPAFGIMFDNAYEIEKTGTLSGVSFITEGLMNYSNGLGNLVGVGIDGALSGSVFTLSDVQIISNASM